MSANYKQNIENYKIPITLFSSSPFLDLEYKYGDTFHKFFNKMLPEIYGHSYYLLWSDAIAKKFAGAHGFKAKKLAEIIASCLELGFFDAEKYRKYHVLTSKPIQLIWLKECRYRNRSNIHVSKRYSCFSKEEVTRQIYQKKFTWEETEPEAVSVAANMLLKINDVVKAEDMETVGDQVVIHPVKEKQSVKLTADQAYDLMIEYQKKKEVQQPEVIVEKVLPIVKGDEPNESTLEVWEFIKIPYEQRTDEFKKMYSKGSYESFIKFNNRVDAESPFTRRARSQLTIKEYIKFIKEMKAGPDDFTFLLDKMMASGPSENSSIYHRFVDFLKNKRAFDERVRSKTNQPKVNWNK